MIDLLAKEVASEEELIERYQAIAGLTFADLAFKLSLSLPEDPNKRKGFIGMAIELALGARGGNKSIPDFPNLGIELKTLPINHLCKPAESTFVTSIPLLTIHTQDWLTSQCYEKLRRVLWLPIEDDERIPYGYRRIGEGILWSPTAAEAKVLANDWEELTYLICTGKLAQIDASMGEYLQIRPKAANSKSLCYGFDEYGHKIQTMPRGFYLRSSFTARILS